MPIETITTSGGAKICQTETPAARATTSSILRDRLRKAIIEPNRTAKGSACSATVGVRRNDSQAMSKPVAFGASPGPAQHLHQIHSVNEEEDEENAAITVRAKRPAR